MGLVDACSEFLKKAISPENAIGIQIFAKSYFLKFLKDTAFNYIM